MKTFGILFQPCKCSVQIMMWCKCCAKPKIKIANILIFKILAICFAVRTGLEPATPCVTGTYSNQTELPNRFFVWDGKNIFFLILSIKKNNFIIFILPAHSSKFQLRNPKICLHFQYLRVHRASAGF